MIEPLRAIYLAGESFLLAHAVDVAGHQMPAQAVRQAQRFLQIDLVRPVQPHGAVDGLLRHVEVEAVTVQGDDREADAVDGDAVAHHHVREVEHAGVDGEAQPQVARRGLGDFSDRGDDAGEHFRFA